jgi:hypothetical protein
MPRGWCRELRYWLVTALGMGSWVPSGPLVDRRRWGALGKANEATHRNA